MLFQKIEKECNSKKELICKYYALILAINNINLNDVELDFLHFIVNKGYFKTSTKANYCKENNISSSTYYNTVNRLLTEGIIQKREKEYCINPVLFLDFNNDLVINIILKHKNV